MAIVIISLKGKGDRIMASLKIMKAIAGGAAIAFGVPQVAQAQQQTVEQSFIPGGVLNLGCKASSGLIGLIFGDSGRKKVDDVLSLVGLCSKSGAITTTPEATVPAATAPDLTAGLQLRVFAVRPGKGNASPTLEPSKPDTKYAKDDGFGVLVANNATGYLEVWSVDATSTSFVEGIILGEAGGVTSLPKTVSGFYKLTTSGGKDTLRFRFYPCRFSAQEAFVLQENQQIGALLSGQAAALKSLEGKIGSCPFTMANLDRTKPNDALFASAANVPLSYSSDASTYTAVSGGNKPMITDIEIKRK